LILLVVLSSSRFIDREEGRAGLYGGMGAHLVRSIPNAAILFLVYELTLTAATRSDL